MDAAPLFLSVRVASVATLAAFIVALPLAWLLARVRFPGRDVASVPLTP